MRLTRKYATAKLITPLRNTPKYVAALASVAYGRMLMSAGIGEYQVHRQNANSPMTPKRKERMTVPEVQG
jgi:hypothetical protein